MKKFEKLERLIRKKIEASSDNNNDDDDDLKLERGSVQVHEQASNDALTEKNAGAMRVPIAIGYDVIRMLQDSIEDTRLRRKYKEYQDKYGDDKNGYVNVIFRMDDKERVMMIYDECYQKYIKKWDEAEAQKASKKTECEPEKEKPKLMIEEEEDYERQSLAEPKSEGGIHQDPLGGSDGCSGTYWVYVVEKEIK